MALKFAKLLLAGAIFILIASCDRRSCRDVNCPSDEQCGSGACFCNDGYEGTTCDTLSALKYVGSYLVTESCNSSTPNYPAYFTSISATQGGSINEITINSLFGLGPAYATIYNVNGNLGNNLTIPNQTVAGSITVSGTGTYVFSPSGAITVTLQLNYSNQNGNFGCYEYMNKQ